ncbi:hypothetical protein GCM10010869_37570 [Mesorhizobium tianshanense]|uniref:Integrase-like protein n=1 Tax=Mesorhizobium tianshanense TaxID=39844 RepID=A0A562P2Y5_9HYPH|nr:DDE-type integrase/transposase/recombinase [Mesorhizobium tianshanense]TWI38805.1 integrase-like protein [Mesorhizobium tianshanense]GLS38163.1 hypothetical protein GCM10010869_37570 [Mesorhizobium tianshanense]
MERRFGVNLRRAGSGRQICEKGPNSVVQSDWFLTPALTAARVSAGGVTAPGLSKLLGAFSRKVIGWAIATHLKAELAIEALDKAIAARRPAPGSVIHHSDRGVQYACADYAARLASHDIQPSMSRIGNPYDDAKAERFMRTLKEEKVDGQVYIAT